MSDLRRENYGEDTYFDIQVLKEKVKTMRVLFIDD